MCLSRPDRVRAAVTLHRGVADGIDDGAAVAGEAAGAIAVRIDGASMSRACAIGINEWTLVQNDREEKQEKKMHEPSV